MPEYVINPQNNPTMAAWAEAEKFGYKLSSTEAAYIAEAVLAASGSRAIYAAAYAVIAPEVARQIVAKVRNHCTPSSEAYEKGGDVLIEAVAAWIQDPPEWVKAPWIVQQSADSERGE